MVLQLLILTPRASAKAVFAHFMVGVSSIAISILWLTGVCAHLDGECSAV